MSQTPTWQISKTRGIALITISFSQYGIVRILHCWRYVFAWNSLLKGFQPWDLTWQAQQLLYENMISDIIPKFPKDKQAGLKEAADSWRLPFWDWAINHRVPTLAKYPTTTIPTPNGKRERVENPLYQFKMSTNEPFLSEGVGQVFDPWAGEGGKGMYFNACNLHVLCCWGL